MTETGGVIDNEAWPGVLRTAYVPHMQARPRFLHDYFPGTPHRLLQRHHQPTDPHALGSVHRAIREETPNLALGREYSLEGEVHLHAYFNIQPGTPPDNRRHERVRAVFVSAWWDRSGPSAVFHTTDAAAIYFRVPLYRFRNGSVRVEGDGLRWPPG